MLLKFSTVLEIIKYYFDILKQPKSIDLFNLIFTFQTINSQAC